MDACITALKTKYLSFFKNYLSASREHVASDRCRRSTRGGLIRGERDGPGDDIMFAVSHSLRAAHILDTELVFTAITAACEPTRCRRATRRRRGATGAEIMVRVSDVDASQIRGGRIKIQNIGGSRTFSRSSSAPPMMPRYLRSNVWG